MDIKIILNGEEKTIKEGKYISHLLEDYKLSPAMVAVELNGKIVKRENFGQTLLQNGDKIEIVKMMGGGY
ncbi:MAG: sulfur carrier protein ThiS [bacterium]